MQDFRNLKVWQKAHKLTLETYAVSATNIKGPTHFALRDQLTRAAISVPANLAEGCGRAGDRELRRFVRVALGSASELEYHLFLPAIWDFCRTRRTSDWRRRRSK
jgi:four helix bundle protein